MESTHKYDLHCHSIASDGTLTPTEVVERATQQGVTHLSLTDHDTLAGITEAQSAASMAGIDFIPGAELSALWRGRTIHIVGLCLDVNNSALLAGIERQLEFRDWRGKEIAGRLERKAGIENAYEGALQFVKGNLVSRTHFARFLVAEGYAKDFGAAIKQYLLKGKAGHVRGDWATLEEVVGWIRAAGGIAVIAHPARYNLTATKLRELIEDFMQAGGEAIEVVSGSHTPADVKAIMGHALRFGLLASSGSDFHTPDHKWVELGKLADLPDACIPVWQSERWQGVTV